MIPSRPYERHDFLSLPMTFKRTSIFIFLLNLSLNGHATPIYPSHVQPQLVRRQDSSAPDKLPPKTWIPILVVVLVLIGLVIFSYYNKRVRSLIASRNAPQVPQGPRELTAAELVGTINANGTAAADDPAVRPRRTRRPRRTPSQISVTSLPVYNKEPGEQELVVIRGREAEDAVMPMATTERYEDGDSSLHSGEERYTPMPASPHDMPLLQEEEHSSGDNTNVAPSPAPTVPTETDGLIHNRSLSNESSPQIPDPRGEAPPYFEVVDAQSPDVSQADTSISSPSTTSPTTTPSALERRATGIRTFFNRMSSVGAPRGLGHARGDSATSQVSSNQSHAESVSPASASTSRGHRPTPSSSSFFKTLSRQRSRSNYNQSGSASVRLNSPSMISLNSISAPLTHTAVRTEFTYPKSGPTPEQLKMISSTESLARFAVPYGADAIAYHASTSRIDLSQSPPDFETAISTSNLNLPALNTAAGSTTSLHVRNDSAGRAMSPLAQVLSSPSQTAPEAEEQETTPAPESNANPSSSQTETMTTSSPESTSSESSVPPATTTTGTTSPSPESTSSPAPATATATTTTDATPSTSSSNDATASVKNKTVGSSHTQFATASSAKKLSVNVDEFGGLHPPSSFHSADVPDSSRSESRASMYSYQSYATAVESIATRDTHATRRHDESEDESDAEGQLASAALDDALNLTQHTQEPTDTTIVHDKRGTIIGPSPQQTATTSTQVQDKRDTIIAPSSSQSTTDTMIPHDKRGTIIGSSPQPAN